MVTVHDRVLNYGSEGRDREAEEDEGLHGNKVLRFWLFQRHVNDSARDTRNTHISGSDLGKSTTYTKETPTPRVVYPGFHLASIMLNCHSSITQSN